MDGQLIGACILYLELKKKKKKINIEISATEGVIHVKCASCVEEGLGFGCTRTLEH